MKKIKYFICLALTCVMSFAFGGCLLSDLFTTMGLTTPRLSFDSSNNTISWLWDPDAVSYTLYDGLNPLDTFTTVEEGYELEENPVLHTLSIEPYLTEYKEYNFKIQAFISEDINKYSDVVVYLYKNPNIAKDDSYGVIINNSNLAPQNVTYSNYTLSWDPVENAGTYFVCAIHSDGEILSFSTTETQANVFDYVANGITIFRVGSNMGEGKSYFSSMVPVNTVTAENTYKQIYFFNGELHDYYINSAQELVKVLYYSFITKDTSIDVRFSPAGLIDVMGSETALTSSVIGNYVDAITETCYYDFRYEKDGSIYQYNFVFDFKGYATPTTHNDNVSVQNSANVTLNQSNLILPYYENYTFSQRQSDYDSFASDNQMILVNCSTSEELYWAIEGGATPVFTSTTSKAYTLYQNAKSVLVDIISNQMTEYEKVLSIYDNIAYNSVYDYAALTKSYPTKYKCFYLESLLEDYASTRVAVCDGYSKTFSLLCNMEGIDAYRVTGVAVTSNGEGAHAWNKVKLDDKWYVVDITWTESTLIDEDASTYYNQQVYEILGHSYFLVNDNFVLNDHYEYSNPTDRSRFTSNYGFSAFTEYFPTIYLDLEINTSADFYDYYSNTTFANPSNPSQVCDRIINTALEAQALVSHLESAGATSVEFMISSTATSAVTQAIINVMINAGFSGYELYTNEITYSSTSNTVSGFVYVFGIPSSN